MEQTWQLEPETLLQGGKYRIVKLLGNDGFGFTYEAELVRDHQKVVIKEFFLKDSCGREGDTARMKVIVTSQQKLVELFRDRFIQETQLMKRLHHPHIIRVTDSFDENDTSYYVMEYLPGGSLQELVRKRGPLPEPQAEFYILQVAAALAYIHSQNAAHLDVRPSNILLNEDDEAVLVDFGGSKHWSAKAFWMMTSRFDADGMTGKVPSRNNKGYTPLEFAVEGSASRFKPSTDIYSLGATLFYLVTGTVPPEAGYINQVGWQKPDNISSRMWYVVTTAMQPQREDRPQSIEDFLALLDVTKEEAERPVPRPRPTPPPPPPSVPEPEPEPVYIPQVEPVSTADWTPQTVSEQDDRPQWVQEYDREATLRALTDPGSAPEGEMGPAPYDDANRALTDTDVPMAEPVKKKKSHVIEWVGAAVGLVAAVVLALIFLLPDKHGNETPSAPQYSGKVLEEVEEAKPAFDEQEYLGLVNTCRDSIEVWGDFRGAVPSNALRLLSDVKDNEALADGYNESAALADELIQKMEAAMKTWEATGDAQKRVNPDLARQCYQLVLDLGKSVQSVQRDVLGMTAVDDKTSGVQKKIDAI